MASPTLTAWLVRFRDFYNISRQSDDSRRWNSILASHIEAPRGSTNGNFELEADLGIKPVAKDQSKNTQKRLFIVMILVVS